MKYITDNQKNETGQQFGCSMELDSGGHYYMYIIMQWFNTRDGGHWAYHDCRFFPYEAEQIINQLNLDNEE